MIFVDSNIPMYLVGAAHPNRDRAASVLRGLVARQERLVSSAEVYQEILHRYRALERLPAAADAFAALDGLVDEVVPIDHADVGEARRVLEQVGGLSARDALHVAVMRRHDVRRILTFDVGFDRVDDVERLS